MAYSNYENQLEEDEDEVAGQPAVKSSNQSSGAPGGSGSGPSSAPVAPMGSGGGSANNQRKFAGIHDYLKSNKNQTANLANQVGGTVRAAGDEARGAISSGVDKFGKDVDENTVKVDDNVINRVKEDPTALVGGVKDTSNLNTKPNNGYVDFGGSSFAGRNVTSSRPTNPAFNVQGDLSKQKEALTNLGYLTKFVGMRDAEYGGPTSLLDEKYYNPMQKGVSEAEAASAATKTEEGTKGLVGDLHKKQIGYVNTGALGLDNALLRGDQGARDIIAGAAASNDDLNKLLTTAVGTAEGRAAAGQAETDRTRAIARGAVTGSRREFEQELNNRVNDAINSATTVQDAIRNVLETGGTPTPDQLAAMGITQEQWTQITNPEYAGDLDLSSYLTTTDPNINTGTYATNEDYARDAALELLMGESDDTLTDPSLAGQYDDGVNFDVPAAIARVDEVIAARRADREAWEGNEIERIRQAQLAGDYSGMGYRDYPGYGKW